MQQVCKYQIMRRKCENRDDSLAPAVKPTAQWASDPVSADETSVE